MEAQRRYFRQFKIDRLKGQGLILSFGWHRLWLLYNPSHKVSFRWRPEMAFAGMTLGPFIVALFWLRTFKEKRELLPFGGAKWN